MPVDLVLFAEVLDRGKSELVEELLVNTHEHLNVFSIIYKDIASGNYNRVNVFKTLDGDYYTKLDILLVKERVTQVVRPVTVWEKVYD